MNCLNIWANILLGIPTKSKLVKTNVSQLSNIYNNPILAITLSKLTQNVRVVLRQYQKYQRQCRI